VNVEVFYREAGIALERFGSRWRARCPFHREKDPSFVVYSDGSYHCFGCRAHGTAKDIQKRFDLNYQPFPDLYSTKDPLAEKFIQLKSKMEDELNLLVVDLDNPVKFKAYDLFDALMIDARALVDHIETTLLDLIAFTKKGFTNIEKIVEEKQHG
jgi:hypothetical protein